MGEGLTIYIPRSSLNFSISRVANFPNKGFGKIHMNLWESPFSLFAGISIRFLATPGCVYPPIVSLVADITKLASPLTVRIVKVISVDYFSSFVHFGYSRASWPLVQIGIIL